jgi:hypothetical protein
MKFFLLTILCLHATYAAKLNLSPESCPIITAPSKMAIEIYEKEKLKIFSFNESRLKFLKKPSIVWEDNPFIKESLEALFKLKLEDLLKLILLDDSQELLVFILFTYQNSNRVLIFRDIPSLFSFEIEIQTRIEILENVFEGFRAFLLNGIFNSKPVRWLKSEDSSVGCRLLELYRDIWSRKVCRLKRLVKSPKVKEEKVLIEEKFTFLSIFLASETENLLDWEYSNLLNDVKGGVFNKVSPSIRNFSILSSHFKMQLLDIEDPGHLSRFRRFASKDKDFLRHFLYFSSYSSWEYYSGRMFESSVRSNVKYHMELNNESILIFKKPIESSFENYDELRILVATIISKAYDGLGIFQ